MAVAEAPARQAASPDAHPISRLVRRRIAIGFLTLFLVSVVVFLATEVLPGNAAYAILGRNANPARVQALENALHLNRGLVDQYWVWISGLFTGNLGHSLVNGLPVWSYVEPRLINSGGAGARDRDHRGGPGRGHRRRSPRCARTAGSTTSPR